MSNGNMTETERTQDRQMGVLFQFSLSRISIRSVSIVDFEQDFFAFNMHINNSKILWKMTDTPEAHLRLCAL